MIPAPSIRQADRQPVDPPPTREVRLVGDPERRYVHLAPSDLGPTPRARPRGGRRPGVEAGLRP